METPTIDPGAIIEVDPRVDGLARQPWRYTARPMWSSASESLWMRLSKFSHCNRMSMTEMARLFAPRDSGNALTGVDLRSPAHWDLHAIASHLEIHVEEVQASFCCDRVQVHAARATQAARACAELRYCERCLSTGFHAPWFQWPHVERCPRHGAPLRTGCHHCKAAIPYVLGAGLALSPLRCTNCHCDWVPSLARPAGRCLPMSDHESSLMLRWAECVRECISVADAVGRDRKTGRYLGAQSVSTEAKGRPHVLTMFNRLYEDPPPTLRELTANAMAAPTMAPTRAAAIIDAVDDEPLDYRLADWPHFALGFAAHERLVRAARTRLFDKPYFRTDDEQGHRLLSSNLVTPVAAIDRATAASLGWSVSWFSPCQALVPAADFRAPAFGLAAWLARIPQRPSTLPHSAWNRRVSRWLLHDLALSARLWEQMADFMSTRGHYLLYGEAVSPRALASLHDVDE